MLNGGDGDLVRGVHGDTLTEAGEDVLQLFVCLTGFGEQRAKQLPRLSHAQNLRRRRKRRQSVNFQRDEG